MSCHHHTSSSPDPPQCHPTKPGQTAAYAKVQPCRWDAGTGVLLVITWLRVPGAVPGAAEVPTRRGWSLGSVRLLLLFQGQPRHTPQPPTHFPARVWDWLRRSYANRPRNAVQNCPCSAPLIRQATREYSEHWLEQGKENSGEVPWGLKAEPSVFFPSAHSLPGPQPPIYKSASLAMTSSETGLTSSPRQSTDQPFPQPGQRLLMTAPRQPAQLERPSRMCASLRT